jgi:DNA-binding CsgD family transcriptional regulator
MWGVVENSGSRVINIGVYRDLPMNPFQSKDLELLRFLEPHLQRAFRLYLRLSEFKRRSENLQEAVDMLTTGVIFLASSAHIIDVNRTAAAILAENDGLVSVGQRLCAEVSGESAQLRLLISRASAISIGTGVDAAGGMTISRRIRPPLNVLIAPVRRLNITGAVSAVAFVVDPAQHDRPASEILYMLFGLTPAECRLALLLGDGHSPPAIADIIGVSANTLKTQLSRIYRKTGTSRQAQLVRVLSQLSINIDNQKNS